MFVEVLYLISKLFIFRIKMHTPCKTIQLVKLGLFLVAAVLANDSLVGVLGENRFENTTLAHQEHNQSLPAKNFVKWIITIDSVDLKSILTSESHLSCIHDNHTEHFLSEYKHFLMPFSWNEPWKNDVMRVAADYNKKHFGCKCNESIRLWVSFQPRMDINDDMEVITNVIREINTIYQGTVAAIVLNYGLLQLDQESFLLVNHEMKKVNSFMKNLRNESMSLAVQLDIANCKNRERFIKNLEFDYMDVVLYSVSSKEFVAKNLEDCVLATIAHIGCLPFSKKAVPSTFHSHMKINISLDKGSYDCNSNLIRHYKDTKTQPIIFGVTLDSQETQANSKHITKSDMSSEWVYWLQQPFLFSKLHFGAVISVKEYKYARIFRNFSNVMIEIDGHTPDTRNHLKQMVADLISLAEKTELSLQKRAPLQVTLLVTIAKNDFESNKKQVDNAIWAAAYANERAPGVVNGIAFDWMSCSKSEKCSGYKNKNPKLLCSLFKMSTDVDKLYNYTKWSLEKVKNFGYISLWNIMDADVFPNLVKDANECHPREYRSYLNVKANKFLLSAEELTQTGAAKMINIVTAQLNQFNAFWRHLNVTIPYYYVKLEGCNGNYSDATYLTEFVLLYEKLNKWAMSNNKIVYVSAGVENPEECEEMRYKSRQVSCKCGFWVVKNVTLENQQPSARIFSKRALALKLYESKLNVQPAAREKSTSALSIITIVSICAPLFIFATLVTVVALFLTLRYRAKYIMTKAEVANFLKGRLLGKSKDEYGSAEDMPYHSTKYELPSSSFAIDKSSCIGSGEFGKVFRGSVVQNGRRTDSAVKVANTLTLGKSHGGRLALLGLLSEIKILSYLGDNDHIVGLLGAFTANLRKGELAVFLEFCELGSLYNYLRSINLDRDAVTRVGDVGATALKIVASQSDPSRQDCLLNPDTCDELYGYCGQIACGMAFLASKNVVHADLATRNVLLSREKVAKICDFGLSRRMYDYSEYLKRSQAPMPWRWMPPESLQRLIFNEKSDVWAFGITLWEIFTLGDEPYPGLSYQVNFPAMLERGMRLPAPRYNVKQIYSVMKRCWNSIPAERPSFVELHTKLLEM